MDIWSIVKEAGAVLRLLPIVKNLPRWVPKLTLTGDTVELYMGLFAIIVGTLTGLVMSKFTKDMLAIFTASLFTLFVFIIGMKIRERFKLKITYHPEGYITVEGKEGVFCPKCFEEKGKFIPLKRSFVGIPTIDGDWKKLPAYVCRYCGKSIPISESESS